eukprot:TRINITY_DN5366_c0_g1_i4.p1 TRINITY_DN5366_c0_g1~~TRINITY_DN5366_c0_g1_i4.p1  ORF type:complete len:394 (+),score=106.67 TRINITY_DN5366_c0_g1_i4:50-1231(+)
MAIKQTFLNIWIIIESYVLPKPIKDYEISDYPAITSKLKIISSSIFACCLFLMYGLGSGEALLWPQLVANYGGNMVWGVWVSIILQGYFNIEIIRYTLATGETILMGYSRVFRGVPLILLFFIITSWIIPTWAAAAGSALRILIVGADGAGSNAFWTFVCFGLIVYFSILTRYSYFCRKIVALILVILMTALIVSLASIPSNEAWKETFWGYGQIGTIEPEFGITELFTLMIFAGHGGLGNTFISLMIRETKCGICSLMPWISNPIIKPKLRPARFTGFIYRETKENQQRFNFCFRIFSIAQIITSVFLLLFLITIYIALSIEFFYIGQLSDNFIAIVRETSTIIEQSYNISFSKVYLIGYFLVLFTSQIIVIDYVSKMIAEVLFVNWSKFIE